MKLKRGLWEGKINETSYSFKKSSKIDEPQQDSQKEDFPRGSDGKESAWNIGDPDLICGLGRFPGEENGNPLKCSYLGNPMDRGAWRATVYGVQKSCVTNAFTFTFLT